MLDSSHSSICDKARENPSTTELARLPRIAYFADVRPKPQCNEFGIEGAGTDSPDAALHESMLQNEDAAAMSEIAAVQAAIDAGIPLEMAVRHLAGDLARAKLIAAGLLSE